MCGVSVRRGPPRPPLRWGGVPRGRGPGKSRPAGVGVRKATGDSEVRADVIVPKPIPDNKNVDPTPPRRRPSADPVTGRLFRGSGVRVIRVPSGKSDHCLDKDPSLRVPAPGSYLPSVSSSGRSSRLSQIPSDPRGAGETRWGGVY